MTHEEYDALEEIVGGSYNRGYADGLKTGHEGGYRSSYEKGLEDAWKCANKINDMNAREFEEVFGYTYYAGCMEIVSPSEAMQKIKEYEKRRKQDEKIDIRAEYEKYYMPIGEENMRRKREQREQAEKCENCTKEISAECVVDGCEFETKQTDATDSDEIKVGDEVVFCDSFHGARYVVVRIRDDGTFDALCDCGTDNGLDLKKCHKTGRQFPQISEVLEQLRGE